MSTSVKLSIYLNGELKGIKVVQLPCIIGRSRESGVVISHPLVSRKHCLLCLERGKTRLRDLGSLNGVTFQGKTILDTVIEDREIFSIGNISFMVSRIEGEVRLQEKGTRPHNVNGVYEGVSQLSKPVKLAPFPLSSSIPPASSTQFFPAPPPSVKSGEIHIFPSDFSDVVDLAAKPPVIQENGDKPSGRV
ncbi:MAG: FHA domain-containing protein [Planctomycetaceae bacterium]|jgi:pSer/pThr/pTyr-binding forkhead associated (FHA) protein|nr:FHA domain-containing protein [Planctomycetaceae bacterium]